MKILRCKRTVTMLSFILICSLCFSTVVKASSKFEINGGEQSVYYARNGACYTMKGARPDLTKNFSIWQWSEIQVKLLYSAKFYSPSQTKSLLRKTNTITSSSKYKDAVKIAIETAASAGVSKAKEVVAKKFGEAVLRKVIPYLNLLSWSKTLFDICSCISQARYLSFLEKAVKSDDGIVIWKYGENYQGYSKWNGSSEFGTYPYAKITSKWTTGTMKIY